MALNGTGAISLGGATTGQSVNLELGLSGTAQISFNDAGVRTLTGTTAGTSLVMPTGFYGKSSAPVISIADRTIEDITSANSNAEYRLNSSDTTLDGKAYASTNTSGRILIGNWVTPTTSYADYEVYASIVAGSGTISTYTSLNAWTSLTTSQWWRKTRTTSTPARTSVQVLIQIRKKLTTTILDSATITLIAETTSA